MWATCLVKLVNGRREIRPSTTLTLLNRSVRNSYKNTFGRSPQTPNLFKTYTMHVCWANTLQFDTRLWTDYLSVSLHQLSGTLCLHLLKVPLPSSHSSLSRYIWKQNCSLLHTTQSNISSAAGASGSNSRHTAPPINVFDIDIDILCCSVVALNFARNFIVQI